MDGEIFGLAIHLIAPALALLGLRLTSTSAARSLRPLPYDPGDREMEASSFRFLGTIEASAQHSFD